MPNLPDAAQTSSPWIAYGHKNRRDKTMALLWIEPLLTWIARPTDATFQCPREARILDFGCGYLDVGIGLRDMASIIDGYDIDPQAREIAAARLQNLGLKGHIYDRMQEIPPKNYDLIIVNSVLQYLRNLEDLRFHLEHLTKLVRHKGVILISDLIPPNYIPYKDAIHSLLHATRHGCLRPMIRHLWFAATKGDQLTLLKIDRATISQLARELALNCSFLPHNLTPSPYRYSVFLSQNDRLSQIPLHKR